MPASETVDGNPMGPDAGLPGENEIINFEETSLHSSTESGKGSSINDVTKFLTPSLHSHLTALIAFITLKVFFEFTRLKHNQT